jgi:hypothetical protein
MRSTTSEVDVRLFVYRHFVSECRAPTVLEVAEAFDADHGQIREAFEVLEQGHVLVLHPDTREVMMAMPFSAVPTTFTVTVGESSWWAN